MESWTYRAGRKILEIIGPVCSNIGINDLERVISLTKVTHFIQPFSPLPLFSPSFSSSCLFVFFYKTFLYWNLPGVRSDYHYWRPSNKQGWSIPCGYNHSSVCLTVVYGLKLPHYKIILLVIRWMRQSTGSDHFYIKDTVIIL